MTATIVGASGIGQRETALASAEVTWTQQMQQAVEAVHRQRGNPRP